MRRVLLIYRQGRLRPHAFAGLLVLASLVCGSAMGQQSDAAESSLTTSSTQAQLAPPATPIVVHITLSEAEKLARLVEPTWLTQLAARGSAVYDRRLALAGLLPQVNARASALYTQPNGVPDSGPLPGTVGPVFIANNSVHEYVTQGIATEKLSVAGAVRIRQANALTRQARAQAEIALRGLHVAVASDYFSVLAAEQKVAAAQSAEEESKRFVDLTRKLEGGREVAHADVIKAELQWEQRQRDAADARQNLLAAKVNLGVLLFPNPATPYELDNTLNQQTEVPAEAQVQQMAVQSNPVLGAALAAEQAASADVKASWAQYLPALTLDAVYGIDAPYFQTTGNNGRKFLGYSLGAGVDIPIWNWFSTQDRIQQSRLRARLAKATLDSTQRQLVADLDQSYGELQTASAALTSLQASVGQSQESLHLTTLRYQSGEATALEVVDAQNTFLATELAAADGAVRYHLARANLERLTGILP